MCLRLSQAGLEARYVLVKRLVIVMMAADMVPVDNSSRGLAFAFASKVP